MLDVRGFGRRNRSESRSTDVPAATLVPRVKRKMAVPDEPVDDVMEASISTAQTGRLGNGKIFVTDLERAVRIRNRESGNGTLTVAIDARSSRLFGEKQALTDGERAPRLTYDDRSGASTWTVQA